MGSGWDHGRKGSGHLARGSHEVLRLPDGSDVVGVHQRPEPRRHLLRGRRGGGLRRRLLHRCPPSCSSPHGHTVSTARARALCSPRRSISARKATTNQNRMGYGPYGGVRKLGAMACMDLWAVSSEARWA